MKFENARSNNVELRIDQNKLKSKEFSKLWSEINSKSAYVVDSDTDELVSKCIALLNRKLYVSQMYFKVEEGEMKDIKSREDLVSGASMIRDSSVNYRDYGKVMANHGVKYDLVGRLVDETGLTRKTIIQILCGIKKSVFEQFKINPEEFIMKAASFINEQKAEVVTEHITYKALDEKYDINIFSTPVMKGKLGINAMKVQKHLYDYIVYDSANEMDFVQKLDVADEVAVYVKLPDTFYISTPVGRYTPDWAIAFHENTVEHICFIAETKGSMSSLQMRLIEEAKIHCAKEHFKVVSDKNVVYDVVDSYDTLIQKAMKV